MAAANAAANAAAAEAAARAAAPAAQGMLTSQVSMRESVSSASDSLDDDLDISQEPTGAQSSTQSMCVKRFWELSGDSPVNDREIRYAKHQLQFTMHIMQCSLQTFV